MKKSNVFNLVVYIIVIFSYLSSVLYQYSSLMSAILSIGVIGVILLWLIKERKQIKYSEIFLICISSILIIITQKFNLISITLIGAIIILLNSQKKNINVRSYLKITVLCFVLVVISYFILGLNKKCDTTIWRIYSNTIEYRYALGFNHPNQAMFKWLCIALGFLSLGTRKNIFKISTIIGGLTLIIYHFTVSRTAVVVIFFVIFSMILFRKSLFKYVSSNFRKILSLIPVIFTIVSVLSIYLSKFTYINNLFSGRFMLYKQYFHMAGINILGNNYIENNAMLDNSYLHMLLSKGLIFSLCYMILMYRVINNSKNITRSSAIIILGYFIAALIETMLFKFDLFILIIIIIYRDTGEVEKYE